MSHAADSIITLYERHAKAWDRDRRRDLFEKAWLDQFLDYVPKAGSILDLGCGMGEPIARYFIERGFAITGIDSAESLIALCQSRFPAHTWYHGDMRNLSLERQFDGIIAWDSFFHLTAQDQSKMFSIFAQHAKQGAALMFTSGSEAGETIATWLNEPLFHASLSTQSYRELLTATGFAIRAYSQDDPNCGDHTIWLAQKQ